MTGLEGLDEEIPLRVRFWPPSNISVQGGYDHIKTIRPEDVGPDGSYSFGVRVTGISRGGWGASARLEVPEPDRSVVDRYVLVLDGKPVGEVEPVSGVGPSSSPEPTLSFMAGLDLARPFYEWVDANFDGPQRRDGQVVGVDAAGRGLESTEFQQAFIDSIEFPALDAGDGAPAYMTVTVKAAVKNFQKKKSLNVDGVAGPKTKTWLCSNFRLELGDLPVERVAKIESFNWKQKVIKDEVDSRETPDLKLHISGADASSWERWHRAFYIIDRSRPKGTEPDPAPGARLVFLGPDGNEELGRLELRDITFSSLEIRNPRSSADTREVSIEIVGPRLSLYR